ncbi:MAG: CDP-glucose 4,6-dehydratase [Firmicutes bacterium]|jgi:CDP-glucose 4,6-dehydratase|nr:CDP-glucose 4,6-dehydratase [Bacillota bacterium]
MEGLGMMTNFYKNKRVFVTGHTGFKGSWLCQTLVKLGADVIGYALEPEPGPNLFSICGLKTQMRTVFGDIRDHSHLQRIIQSTRPEFVFHLAAQPIVRESYSDPRYTFETNVMGTVNLLECVRKTGTVRSLVNVTTDKVYDNLETDKAYREEDRLDGYDPYSNSKSCSELVTHSYKRSFFAQQNIAISTARAGNVIGGGDFAKDRIIPDCVRAAETKQDILIRNPYSIRPYQHVLDPIFAYLLIAKRQYENSDLQGCYNVGPDDRDCVSTGQLADLFCEKWGGIHWIDQHDGGPHEAAFLKLDSGKLKEKMAWHPVWHIETAVEKTVQWTKAYLSSGNPGKIMVQQIEDFIKEKG